jgi:diguanylate cyclase (GGDEF)-like protein
VLLNRRAFEVGLSRELMIAEAQGARLSVVALDIDHFKNVNDSFGHPTGDEARTVRRGELLGRLGGEEFLWLLPGSGGEDALHAAERARLAIASVPFLGVGTLTVSAGVCELADSDAAHLISCADQALYRAKQRGRNNTVRYATPDPAS